MPNDNDEKCPHCDASLQGEPIPEEYIAKGYYGDTTHYSLKIGIEIRGEYDGVLYWQCPFCGGRWHRFPKGDTRHFRAMDYVEEIR